MKHLLMITLLSTTLLLGACGGDAGPTPEQRATRAAEMMQKAQAEPNFPKTPEAAITAFWQAASRKDYDRMQLLAPGSDKSDYAKYYDMFTPQPAKSVGKPEPHPANPKVQLYPAHVPFPGFPQKVVKMAVWKDEKGNYYIDGQNTIWW